MTFPREADPVAATFARGGWVPAVLLYSIQPDPAADPLSTRPLHQLGQAVRLLRAGRPGPVAVCGLSAGGHLAASLGVHWQALDLPRPDALILGYPVITSGPYTHAATLENLAGTDTDLRDFFSLERHAGAQVPPTFLWHTVTDPNVPVQNSLLLAEALSAAGVRYEMYLYPRGVHGLSLATPEVDELEKNRLADPHIAGWFGLCLAWLAALPGAGALAALQRKG